MGGALNIWVARHGFDSHHPHGRRWLRRLPRHNFLDIWSRESSIDNWISHVMTVEDSTPQSDTLGPISSHHPAHLAAFEARQVRVAEGRPAPVSKVWTQLVNWDFPPSSPRIENWCVLLVGWLHEA